MAHVRRSLACLLATLGLFVAPLAACSGSQATARTQTTRAQISTAGSPELKTVDNTGFVGPAGHTGTVVQGVGAAAVGRREPGSPDVELPPTTPMVTAPSDPEEAIERAARAWCDRESTCERVGPEPGKAYGSTDACMAAKRARIQGSPTAKTCSHVIAGDRLGPCLAAIRGGACDGGDTPPADCTPAALCGPA